MTTAYINHTFANGKVGTFRVFPARWERIEELDGVMVIDQCNPEDATGYGVDLFVHDRTNGESLMIDTAYPEEDNLWASLEDAIDYITSGDAEASAMRSKLGDNLDHFDPVEIAPASAPSMHTPTFLLDDAKTAIYWTLTSACEDEDEDGKARIEAAWNTILKALER